MTRASPVGVDGKDGPDEQESGSDQPALAGEADLPRQRRGRARRPPAAAQVPCLCRSGDRLAIRRRLARCRGRVVSVVIAGPAASSQRDATLLGESPPATCRFSSRSRRWSGARETSFTRSTAPAPSLVDDLGPHDRRDVLRRLEAPVVLQLDKTLVGDRRIGREEECDIDVADLRSACRVVGPPASSCTTSLNFNAVDPLQPDETQRAGRTLRRPAECELGERSSRGHSACAGRTRDAVWRVTTNVLASCAGAGVERGRACEPSSARSSAACVSSTSAPGRHGAEAQEAKRGSRVLGDELHQAARERGCDELAGAETERALVRGCRSPSSAWLYISASSRLSAKSNEPTVTTLSRRLALDGARRGARAGAHQRERAMQRPHSRSTGGSKSS